MRECKTTIADLIRMSQAYELGTDARIRVKLDDKEMEILAIEAGNKELIIHIRGEK